MLQMSLDKLDPLGYIPLHIPTDPLDEDLDTFVKFSGEMEQNSVKPTDEAPNLPFSAYVIPDTFEGRQVLIKKVFSLFRQELKILGFNNEQILAVTGALKIFIPDPFNGDFEHIFKDRICGFFAMMMLLKKLFLASSNKDVVVTQAKHLSAGLDEYVGIESFLSILPYEQFRDVLYPKTGRLSCLTEILQFSPHFKSKVEQLDEILTVYFCKVIELGLNEPEELRYRKFLMSKICYFDARRPDLDLHFKKLGEAMDKAFDRKSLAKAIQQFGEVKLNVNLAEGSNATGARNFPQFFTELKLADRELGRNKPPVEYSVVGTLGSTKIRETARKRITDLFNAEVKDSSLRKLLEGGVGSLLDSANPDFDEALADRGCGAIELLRLTYNDMMRRIERGGDAAPAFVGFAQLVQGVDRLPWKSRNGEQSRRDVLIERLERRRVVEFLVRNVQCFDSLCARMNGTADLLREIRANFMEAVSDLGINFNTSAQWFYVFAQNLAGFVKDTDTDKIPELKDALSEIRDIFESATKPQEISGAISTFVQRTLPMLGNKSIVSQPSA